MNTSQQPITPTIEALEGTTYKIELTTSSIGKPVGRYYKRLTSGPNKGRYKLLQNFAFSKEENRTSWVENKLAVINKRIQEKTEVTTAKKKIRADMQHGFAVGQILYDSWGYDQTNIDFYEVVEVKTKSVLLQSIGAEVVSQSEGIDSAFVVPDATRKFGPAERKVVQFYLRSPDNTPVFYIKMETGSLSLYDAVPKGLQKTWGR